MSKYVIPYKLGCKSITESLGIPDDRADELSYRIDLIMHELFRPTKDGVVNITSDIIMRQFLSLAENHAEAIWLAYAAGMHVEGLMSDDEEETK